MKQNAVMRNTLYNKLIEYFFVIIFFGIATIFMYAPISTNMGTMISDRWDGALHTWELAWNVHKFTTGLGGFWDANIFWPHPDSLAYTDHLLSQSIIAAPFLIATGNPILAHNAVTFASFALCGFGMFLLVRRLTKNIYAAMISGIIYAYCPWRYGQIGHETQMLANQWLPFSLLFLHISFDGKRLRDGALFGFFFGLHALSSYYHAAMGFVAVITIILVHSIRARGRFSASTWKNIFAGAVIAAIMIAPTMPTYYRVKNTQGLERALWESANISADPFDYFSAPPQNRLWGNITGIFATQSSTAPGENHLFVGFTALLLAIIAFRKKEIRDKNPAVKTYFWVATVAFLFSLGPWLHLFWRRLPIPMPYLIAYYILPGFSALRVPSRFGSIVELGLAVMAAYGYMGIAAKLKTNAAKSAAAFLVIAMLFAEFYSSPLPAHKIPTRDNIPAVYKWLAGQQGDFAIVEIPQISNLSKLKEEQYERGDPLGFLYMYYSAYHWKSLVNGRSGFIPFTTEMIYDAIMQYPSPRTLKIFDYLDVKYVVLHSGAFEWENNFDPKKIIDESDRTLEREAAFGSDIVYRVSSTGQNRWKDWWNRVQTADVFFPNAIRPKTKFNLEIKISGVDLNMPLYSFELIDFHAAAFVKGPNGKIEKQSKRFRDFIFLDPEESRWMDFTFESPQEPGRYDWNIEVSFNGRGEFHKSFQFSQTVGDFPDSGSPDILKASFISIEAPEQAAAGAQFKVRVRVRNDGNTLWRAHRLEGDEVFKGVVMLAIYDWLDSSGKPLELWKYPNYCVRGFLEKSVPPGGETDVYLEALAPSAPGNYKIKIEMVSEYVKWFDRSGGEVIYRNIEVIPK